jgi:hypothetical protein
MSAYYNRRSYSRRSIGHERALEHIRQAKELSRELGGTDEDVKKYFFNLPAEKLNAVLDSYEKTYGRQAREYAMSTLPKWKSGQVSMSGMNATRLFNLLPPIMPLETKFKLIESLWSHVGPSSKKVYYYGPDVDVDEVATVVGDYLDQTVHNYSIPDSFERRFNWLAQGDSTVKQQLLNFFRQREKEILESVIRSKLPILVKTISAANGQYSTRAKQTLVVGKHEVHLIYAKKAKGLTEVLPTEYDVSGTLGCLFWLIAGAAFFYFAYLK